jgi:hypothetical protein
MQELFDRVTITGADDSVTPDALLALSARLLVESCRDCSENQTEAGT